MRKILAGSVLASLAGMALAGMTPASANQGTGVYNGMNDSYAMTGIQEVSFTTKGGNYSRVPVWTMDACNEEDGSGQDACVWHAPTRSNGDGGSIVYVGTGEDKDYAYINHEAARILLHGEPVAAPVYEIFEVAPAPVENFVLAPENPETTWEMDTATDAPVEDEDISDEQMREFGYVEQEDGSWVHEEPVQAITPPYAPDYVEGAVDAGIVCSAPMNAVAKGWVADGCAVPHEDGVAWMEDGEISEVIPGARIEDGAIIR